MAKSEKKRQAKLMAKRRKDQVRRNRAAAVVADRKMSVRRTVPRARDFPIHDCLVNPNYRTSGLATVVVTRRMPNERLLYGIYLVDVFCLGLKNTLCNVNVTDAEFKRETLDRHPGAERPAPCPADLAHTIIYGGIDYAARFEFRPHKDFALSQYVLEPRESVTLRDDVEFGKSGKPLYVAGPHDNMQRVMDQLARTAGEGNYDYFCPL